MPLPRIIGICCLLGALLAGCTRGTPAPTATASPIAPKTLPLIGVSLPDVASTETTLIQKGLADSQRKDAVSLIYRSADGKAEKQATDIADLVRLNVVGLIVLPVDATLVAPPIAAARAKGIPIVAIDTPPIGTAIDSLIRTDDRADGREAAKDVTGKSAANGPALILTSGDAPSVDFVAGAEEALAKVSTPVQTMMVANMLDLPAMVIPAVRDQGVRTIIASDDALALAAMKTLKSAGVSDGVTIAIAIIGHGGTKEAIQAVLDGTLAGDVDTRPQDLGVAAIGNIAALARKKQPASDLTVRINGAEVSVNAVPGRLITRDNVRDMQERWPDLIYVAPATPAPTPTPQR
ncbi:MAG: substrate-binding domain-containing protein [Chloroflexota bacterium]|nr:substrate-binding domain-containing protein [Chloroflexota bacterium]